MVRILRTPLADADLANIWSYVARDNAPTADRLIRQISDAFLLLAANPEIGIRQDDIRPGLRCKPVRRHYLIFYEVVGDMLRILRVLHAARRYEDLL